MSRFAIVFLSILLKSGATATVKPKGKKIFHHENILEFQGSQFIIVGGLSINHQTYLRF